MSKSDSAAQKEYPTWSLIKDLSPFLAPYRLRFFLATCFRILGDAAWLYPAFGFASAVTFLSTYKQGDSIAALWVIFALFFAAIAARYLGLYFAKMLMFRVSERMSLDLQMASISHMFSLDIAWHEHENTGNKLKKMVRGAEGVDRILRIWINNIIEIVINFIGITFIIAGFDKNIALLTLVFLITYYSGASFFRRRSSRASIIVNAQEEELHGLLFEAINNIRSVKVLGMARALSKILVRESGTLYGKILTRIFWFQTGTGVRGFYSQTFRLVLLAFIAWGVMHGRYEVGFFVLFYGYFNRLIESVSEFADVTQEYVVAKIGVGRMVEVLHEPVVIDTKVGKVPFPHEWQKISFNNVSFSYGGNAVLRDISFDIKRGEKVGIVGLSGAGKSTIFKLLLKEHESYTGEILVDNVPLTSIEKQDYFKYSAVVLQDTEVFNLSLRDNVLLANGDEAKNRGLYEKALRVAHVDDFMRRLPQGDGTLIGEKGVRLSGGERQRVGIARAVFKNPQLLLLDEATSHLDIESEENIRSSLHEFFRSVTAVVIAHRLTTIKEMDRIIVIEEGKILEEGSFDELYTKKGRFHELWEKQSL